MFKPLWKSEMTKTKGAMKPCHRPSQNPATESLSLAVPFIELGPGAQAARTRSTTSARMNAVSFMMEASWKVYVRARRKASPRRHGEVRIKRPVLSMAKSRSLDFRRGGLAEFDASGETQSADS